jgi:predicted Fe-S protein YdhL (DUF1289 family)
MSDRPRRVPSPCVNICALGDDSICTGCFRSLDEITTWSMLSDEQREVLLKELARRRAERECN